MRRLLPIGMTVAAMLLTSPAVARAQDADRDHPAAKAQDTIEVRLKASPEGARMYLDDSALGANPFVGRFRRDDKPHTLRVEAEGHTSVTRPLSFASDQTADIALARAEAPKDRPTAAPNSAPPPEPTRPGLPVTTTASPGLSVSFVTP